MVEPVVSDQSCGRVRLVSSEPVKTLSTELIELFDTEITSEPLAPAV